MSQCNNSTKFPKCQPVLTLFCIMHKKRSELLFTF
nr:MAG TPA: hypothetical protein [Caudoviricetes sp.]